MPRVVLANSDSDTTRASDNLNHRYSSSARKINTRSAKSQRRYRRPRDTRQIWPSNSARRSFTPSPLRMDSSNFSPTGKPILGYRYVGNKAYPMFPDSPTHGDVPRTSRPAYWPQSGQGSVVRQESKAGQGSRIANIPLPDNLPNLDEEITDLEAALRETEMREPNARRYLYEVADAVIRDWGMGSGEENVLKIEKAQDKIDRLLEQKAVLLGQLEDIFGDPWHIKKHNTVHSTSGYGEINREGYRATANTTSPAQSPTPSTSNGGTDSSGSNASDSEGSKSLPRVKKSSRSRKYRKPTVQDDDESTMRSYATERGRN